MKLYQKSRTLPPEDYQAILGEVERTKAKKILEIGPGYSTFAFIEAGCEIVALEHDPKWHEEAIERFKDYPQVEIRRYWDEPEARGELEPTETFDLAFVDSPKGYYPARKIHEGQEDCSRLNTLRLALKHAPIVLLHDAKRPLERGSLGRITREGFRFTFIPSGYGMARVEHG